MSLAWGMRLAVASVVAAAWGGGCSGCEEAKKAPAPTAVVIARLGAVSGEVAHRAAQAIRWRDADKGLELRHRDAVKTGAGASARVVFKAGGRLEVGERALVVIEAPAAEEAPPAKPGSGQPKKARGAVAQVQQGVVRGQLEPGGAPFTLRTADGQQAKIVAEGDSTASFRVSVKEGGKLEVAVLKGGARVDIGGRSARVAKGEVVDVKGKRISKPKRLLPYPELLEPAVAARLHAGARLELSWKPVPGAALYRVQVSPSLGFSQREVDSRVTVPRFVLPELRAERAYVWRVSSIDAAGHEGEFGFARRFHVLSASAERAGLLAPPDNAGVLYVKAVKPITFRWKGMAERYELRVARDRRLKRTVLRRQTTKSEQRVTSLRRGIYYWGVFALGPKGKRRPLHKKPYRLVIAKRLPPGVQVPKSIDWK